MKRPGWNLLVITLLLSLLPVSPAAAQGGAPGFELRLNRNFGYGGFGQIQGRFTLQAREVPEDVEAVRFYVDDQLLGQAAEPPYQLRFHTDQLSPGRHTFRAAAALEGGGTLVSSPISREVLTADQSWDIINRVLGPLLLAVGLLAVVGAAVPLLFSRQTSFVPGAYGPAGGAVCRECRLPFSRPFLAPNLLVGKLVRCPHCRKWGLRARASREQLDRAETRYRERTAGSGPLPARDQDFDRVLEDSRYWD
jgi:hypothetical protein